MAAPPGPPLALISFARTIAVLCIAIGATALIGWWLSENVLGIPIEGWLGSLVAATAGAVLLLFLFGLIRRR